MKKISIIILLAIFISACSAQKHESFVEINDYRQGGASTKIEVEIADTPELHYKGLSGKEELCEDCGMLFKFNNKQIRTFVMRDMNFPIDIIWINDKAIVGISKNLQPEKSDTKSYYSSEAPVDYVLEVNAGFTDKNNINIRDTINYEL